MAEDFVRVDQHEFVRYGVAFCVGLLQTSGDTKNTK